MWFRDGLKIHVRFKVTAMAESIAKILTRKKHSVTFNERKRTSSHWYYQQKINDCAHYFAQLFFVKELIVGTRTTPFSFVCLNDGKQMTIRNALSWYQLTDILITSRDKCNGPGVGHSVWNLIFSHTDRFKIDCNSQWIEMNWRRKHMKLKTVDMVSPVV